jgi:hypothetical protein
MNATILERIAQQLHAEIISHEKHLRVTSRSAPDHRPCESGARAKFAERLLAILPAEFAVPKPPKPEEPTGLGAVVEDDRGVRWVRTEPKNGMTNPWQATLHVAEPDEVRSLRWAEVVAVKVLSEGVTL